MIYPATPAIRTMIWCVLFGWVTAAAGAAGREVHVIRVEGVVNPVSADFILRHIDLAEEEDAECLVLELDTPGGLMTSMRDITKRILGAEVPVAVYVSPPGSRAASAGVFITISAHIAAMAPSTNIGAAHPVNLGGGGFGAPSDSSGTMEDKIVNDAVAQIRTMAEMRGRNADWAEQSIRESVSITETVALELNVIDYIVPTLDSLLSAIHGRTVETAHGSRTLDTRDAVQTFFEMSWRYKLLDVISDPNVAYILMMIGVYGLLFELYSPGAVLPGAIGAFALILAFFAFQTVPINLAGVLLILLGLILFLVEVYVISYGLLTIGGAAALILGSLMLVDTPAMAISLKVILPAAISTVLFFLFAIGLALKAQRQKPVTGKEGMVGETGVTITELNPDGKIKVHGEIWNARGTVRIPENSAVRVTAVNGLMLRVEPGEPTPAVAPEP